MNCVGITADRVANFSELPSGLPSKILRVNLLSSVRVNKKIFYNLCFNKFFKMIEIILPEMLKRDIGIIVNVSSITVTV